MSRPEVGDDAAFDELTDAVLAASRVLVGVAAQSIAQAETTMSVGQFRALVIIASRGPMHSAGLAEAMGVHPSNATRTCDRLVAAKLLDRRDNPADRRHLMLTLTKKGHRMVDSVMSRRRALIGQILDKMPTDNRHRLAEVLNRFADAGGEPAEQDLWSVGWTTGPAVTG
ncbi:MAG: MarR family winged helix-turn-helix transcriptional regulator [Nakamurella sp.]